jgi:hypothetical protein
MFNVASIVARFRRGKQPERDQMRKHPAKIRDGQVSEETGQEYEAWQRQWAAIQPSIDELVAHLGQDSQP